MPGTVLLIAYHYPPCATSSGVQRTFAFSRQLSQYGWRPIVLTVTPDSYDRTNPEQAQDIPPDVPVTRTVAVDVSRQLSIRGRYWSRLAVPDRWRAWWLTAVPVGLRLIHRHRVDAIWSTYPIATAHRIAATLARLSQRPWIADFRDPMVEQLPDTGEVFPRDPVLRRARLTVETMAVQRAARLVFCTEAARRIVRDRYPYLNESRLEVVPNGYDENAFRAAERAVTAGAGDGRRVLLHSGTIYAGPDRDPTALLQALKLLLQRQVISPDNFELRLRDPSNDAYFRQLAAEIGVANLVSIMPALSYREALAELLTADGLLLLQGYTSNPAIPAKLYEYLRARRPILGLVHPAGETAALLRALHIDSVASLTDSERIAVLLTDWLGAQERLTLALPPARAVAAYSREQLTERLANILDDLGHAAAERARP